MVCVSTSDVQQTVDAVWRMEAAKIVATLTRAVGLTGAAGLMLAPAAQPVLWSLLIGIGMSVFSMALAVIALRSRNAEDTAQLSGMAQGFGYLIAATGPFLFGLLHDVSHGWTLPWVLFLTVYVVQMGAGALAGRARYV